MLNNKNNNQQFIQFNKSYNYDHTKMHYKYNDPIDAFNVSKNTKNDIFYSIDQLNENDLREQYEFYSRLLTQNTRKNDILDLNQISLIENLANTEPFYYESINPSSSSSSTSIADQEQIKTLKNFSTISYLKDMDIVDQNESTSNGQKFERIHCFLISCLNKQEKRFLYVLAIVLLFTVLIGFTILICLYAFGKLTNNVNNIFISVLFALNQKQRLV
jgi:hypothetical protein